jgi:hypothetical protein
MGMNDEDGDLTWTKFTMEDELFADLLKYDEETIKANQELTEKYIKNIKYFGKYADASGKTLLRMEYIMSGEVYNDVFDEYLLEMPEPTTEEETMTAEMMKSFAEGDFGDLTFIVYIDEASKEIVKYEMDLGDMIISMIDDMDINAEEIPAEEMELLKQLKATMTMEILNVNQASDFEIPQEALDAPEMEELIQELEETTNEEEIPEKELDEE